MTIAHNVTDSPPEKVLAPQIWEGDRFCPPRFTTFGRVCLVLSWSRRQAERGRCVCEHLSAAHRAIAKRDVSVGIMLKERDTGGLPPCQRYVVGTERVTMEVL